MGNAPDCLGRLTERAQESLAHPPSIREARFSGDDVNRMAALFHQEPGRLHTQILHRLGRGLTGFGTEGAAKLSGAQVGRVGQTFNGKLGMEIALRIGQGALDAIRFGRQFQQS